MPSGTVIINYTNQNEWILHDGYYYYYDTLKPGDTTSTFIESVTLNPNIGDISCTGTGEEKVCESTSSSTGNKYRLSVKVETAQANKYKEVWNTDFEPPENDTYKLADIVYYDPVSNDPCDASTFNLTNVKEGTSTCYKWRVIETSDSSSSSTIKLQLDHELFQSTWGTNVSGGPNTLLTELSNQTYTWTKLDSLKYTYNTSSYTNNYGTLSCVDGICSSGSNVIGGTSEKPLKARIMTREEFEDIISVEESLSGCTFPSSSTTHYFSTQDDTGFTQDRTCVNNIGGNRTLSWLIDNTTFSDSTYAKNNDYGSNNTGYFLLSPHSYVDTYEFAYAVYSETGYITNWRVDNTFGIRPVIVANKDDVTLGNDLPEKNVINTDSNNNPVYHPGDIVYFDPSSTSTCDSSTFDATKVKQRQSYCYKFRVIETNDSSEKTDITLMLDHNIIDNQQLSGSSIEGFIGGLLGAANGPTYNWTRVPLLNYSYDTTIDGSLLGQSYGYVSCTNGLCGLIENNKKTILSGNARVRVITAEEVDALNVYYGETSQYNKLRNTDITLNSNLSWLYENTSYDSQYGGTTNVYGSDTKGYWTLTQFINQNYRGDFWIVNVTLNQLRTTDRGNSYTGIRPVITVPKSFVTTN